MNIGFCRTRFYLGGLSLLFLSILASSFAVQAADDCEGVFAPPAPLFTIDSRTYEYRGLTPEGLQTFKQQRDILRARDRIFESEFRNLQAVHHQLLVTRLAKLNMILYGPPGAAKSRLVDWLMQGEDEPAFKLQMHQMITEQAFAGGQNFEAAKEGRYEINTSGSLVDHKVGNFDEIEKANPAALAPLLSLLNERELPVGNRIIKTRIESIFATSNASLPEIFQQFLENGQGTTAPALLNRFQNKAFIYNWLDTKDQAILDARRERRRYLKSIAETYPEVLKDEVFLTPGVVDWASMRQLAHSMFKLSPEFFSVFREFIGDMRKDTNSAIKESEERFKTNHQDEPFVYFPSADLTERLRQPIPEIVLMSAFLDFMESPLADDASIEHLMSKPIVLSPVSLWRSYLSLTTVGPGDVILIPGKDAVDVQFNTSFDPDNARDKREELLIRNVVNEETRFKKALLKRLGNLSKQIELAARFKKNPGISDDADFELLMAQPRQ